MYPTSPTLERLRQRVAALHDRHGFRVLAAEDFDAFADQEGITLTLFTEDPARVPEAWDLAVILPDLVASLVPDLDAGHVGILAPATARPLAVRFGIRLWPALLVLKDGAYLGAIEGLQDWDVYARRLPEILAAKPARPPGIGIAVAGAPIAPCH